MVKKTALDGCEQLIAASDLEITECHRHAALRQLSCQRGGDRQPIFGDINEK